MGQHYTSEYAEPTTEQVDGSGDVTESIQASIDEAVAGVPGNSADGAEAADSSTTDPESAPSFEDYTPEPNAPTEDLQGPDAYQNEDVWDRDIRENGPPEPQETDTESRQRRQRPGVSDRREQDVEVPTPSEEEEQIKQNIEALQEGESVELGAGASNEAVIGDDTAPVGGDLTGKDHHSTESRIDAERDQNPIQDEALGESGSYRSPAEGPGPDTGSMAYEDTVATDTSHPEPAQAPHAATQDEIESQLENFGLEDGLGTEGKAVSEEALYGLDEEAIKANARWAAGLEQMEIGGETTPRTPGSTLSQQESIESTKNELIEQRQAATSLADRFGDEKARAYAEQKAKLLRQGVEGDDGLSGKVTHEPDNVGPGPQSSEQQAESLLEQYPDRMDARERLNARAKELADRYDTSESEVRRHVTDSLLRDPNKKSVVHKNTRRDGETVPNVRQDNLDDLLRANNEFTEALDAVAADVAGESDPIPHSGFHKAVRQSGTSFQEAATKTATYEGALGESSPGQEGLRRGKVRGRVKGVVDEPSRRGKGDGIRRIAYIEDPAEPNAPDVKVTIWESNENTPEYIGGGMQTDMTRSSPDPEKGDIIEVENAKVYINHNTAQETEGRGEPVASADNRASVSIVDDSGRLDDSSPFDGSDSPDDDGPSQKLKGGRHGEQADDSDSETRGEEVPRPDSATHPGETETEGFGPSGTVDHFFGDDGSLRYPTLERQTRK